MRNKFAYSCSIKIHAVGFSELLEGIFCILLVVEVFSLQKVVWMLEEVIVGESSVNTVVEAKLCSPVCSTLEAWAVQGTVGRCHGEELGPFY